jgi:hypothetical protein
LGAVTVIPGTVLARDARAVHPEDHRQVLERDVVHDVVVSALQERRVDGDDRLDALRGEAGGEGDAMPFGDAHVEEAIGVGLLEHVRRRAIGHRGGDRDDARVGVRELDQSLAEDLLVARQPRGRLRALPRHLVEGARRVPRPRIVLCGRESLALAREHVDEDRALHVLHAGECLDQLVHVVAV